MFWDNIDPGTASYYMSYFEDWANLPTGTLVTIAQIESSFNPDTGDYKNGCNNVRACGLMQLRPVALQDIQNHYHARLDPIDPIQAIIGAAAMFNINRRYLHYYTHQDPDVNALIAAYNGGWSAGRNYMLGRSIPRETMNYLALADQYMGIG